MCAPSKKFNFLKIFDFFESVQKVPRWCKKRENHNLVPLGIRRSNTNSYCSDFLSDYIRHVMILQRFYPTYDFQNFYPTYIDFYPRDSIRHALIFHKICEKWVV